MSYFDKNLMFSNIAYLLEKKKIKIGDLEEKAGVSIGYISRTKDGSSKPGIDFIVKAADVLGVSIDSLLTVDLSALTPTEQYLLKFFNKLITDTQHDLLDWKVETAASLIELRSDGYGNVDHPLLNYENIDVPMGPDEPAEPVNNLCYQSMAFGYYMCVDGNFYHLRMKNGITLYLTMIQKFEYQTSAPHLSTHAREVWMLDNNGGRKYLARNNDETQIAHVVDRLYQAAENSSKHPKIFGEFKNAIDSFMNNDIADDPKKDTNIPDFGSDDLPF